jgi:hypothetical protein
MSLLAMIADNFELEPPPHDDDDHYFRPVEEDSNNNRSLDRDLLCDLLSNDDGDDKGLSQPLILDGEDRIVNDAAENNDDTKLMLSFVLMLVIGTLNKIFQKLQAIVSL